MANLCYQNARLILPDRIVPGGTLRVEGGKIAALGGEGLPDDCGEGKAAAPHPGDLVYDLGGTLLAPGFIDLHLHGAVGRDTMEASAEAFDAILRFHATGGTTALALTTVAAPVEQIVAVLRAADAYRKAQHAALENHQPLTGAELLGIHVEGPYFSPEKRGAHRPEHLALPTPEHAAPLLEWAHAMTQMTLAPELPGALALMAALQARGVRISGGHSDAWDEQACAAFAHGMSGVTHTFNAMSTARRRGPYRVAGLLEFALSEPGLLCELIADGHHVSPTLMRMLYHAKGPDGIALVTDATAGAGLPEGTRYRLGEVEAVVRNGVGMTVEPAADGMPATAETAETTALAGSTSTMAHLVRTLVRQVGVPLAEAVRMATLNPARALNLPHKGELKPGADADFVLLDEGLEVVATFVRGQRVYRK